MKNLKVLVGCEFSGVVRDAFIAKGHDAISCDLLPTESPGPHYQGDIYDMLNEGWDLIIMHPPCTALCVSGNGTYAEGKEKYQERLDAVKWTEDLFRACMQVSSMVCFENPVGVLTTMAKMPKPQYVQPWMFGHKETKKTALFLHNLPQLKETSNVKKWLDLMPEREKHKTWYASPGKDRGKIRSLTYLGMAAAMADQWSVIGWVK